MDASSCVGRYEGDFNEDFMHGRGVFTSAQGGWTYSGALEQRRPTEGELVEADGRRFKVTYARDCALIYMNPNAKTKVDNGDAYEGEWLNGKLHGQGIYSFADGSR